MRPIPLALLIVGLLAVAPSAQAQKDGSVLGTAPGGSSRQDGAGATHYYDRSGRPDGTSRRDSAGTTQYYDPSGRLAGSSRR